MLENDGLVGAGRLEKNNAYFAIEEGCILGVNVKIGYFVKLPSSVKIGDNVVVGDNVSFADGSVIDIGADVNIGSGSIFSGSLTVGRGSLILPGSVVTRSVPAYAVISGNPAKITGYTNTVSVEGVSRTDKYSTEGCLTGVKKIYLPNIADIRGSLTVGEFERSIPFEAKRYFMVYDVPSAETRGEHAHKECHQFLICVRGSLSVVVDDGKNREEFLLDQPSLGLHLPPMTWGIQYKYSSDAVLLVFASHYYDSDDYIRDYNDFLAMTENK